MPKPSVEKWPRHASARRAGAVGLAVMVAAVAGSAMLTVISIETGRASFSVLATVAEFEREFAIAASSVRIYTLCAGFTNRTESYQKAASAQIEEERAAFERLSRDYDKGKRRSAAVRNSRRAFERVRRSTEAYIDFHERSVASVVDDIPDEYKNDFDTYISAFSDMLMVPSRTLRDELGESTSRFARRLGRISTSASKTTLYLAVVVQALLFAAAICLVRATLRIRGDAESRLAAQDEQAGQLAHEMRNKYAPAMHVIEKFVETARGENVTVGDLRSLKDDMALALVALKEAEAQNQARLDMYKILRGNYISHLETFDVLGFMRERVDVERAIAHARKGGTSADIASFEVRVEDEALAECTEVYVRTDLYVLNHVVANCLSNSRKFTHSGRIVLTLKGARDGKLVFGAQDTGVGLPPGVVDSIFREQVSTGDNRGTGLGLPSCALFCKTAGGYIRLVGTRRAEPGGVNGFTEFEFAVSGTVVRAEIAVRTPTHAGEERTGIRDDVAVVVCDDSTLNRSCLVRRLKKLQNDAKATGWTFAEFETVEAAQPLLRDLHARGDLVLVCLDEHMGSRGGVLTGIQATRWLLRDLRFEGIIVSTSGEPGAGEMHLLEGAHAAWGKPLPSQSKLVEDLSNAFAALPPR